MSRFLLGLFVIGGALFAPIAFAQGEKDFSGTKPGDWKPAPAVIGYVEQLTPDQTIEGMIVNDPANENIVYFATSAADGTLSIYRYNTSTYFFERLWREDGTTDKELNVVGYENGNVIYAETTGGYDAGDCGSALLDGTLKQIPATYAESWAAGPSDYTAADETLQTARDERTACEGGQETE